MAELINVRCGQGKLILTETHIIIEGVGKSHMMERASFTGMDAQWGFAFSYTIIFHGKGGTMKATLVKKPDMLRIREILTGR